MRALLDGVARRFAAMIGGCGWKATLTKSLYQAIHRDASAGFQPRSPSIVVSGNGGQSCTGQSGHRKKSMPHFWQSISSSLQPLQSLYGFIQSPN